MAQSYVLQRNLSVGGVLLRSSETVSADGATSFDGTVPASTTDHAINLDIDVSEIKGLFILSDQDLILQTNNGTTPADTITLEAGVALIWSPDDPLTNPLGTDVTVIYATNAGGTDANLQIYVLQDVTA